MDDIHVVESPEKCTAKSCTYSDTLEESTVRVEELKQQVQHWRQKYNECTKEIMVLENSVKQTRRLFNKQLGDSNEMNKSLKNENKLLEIEIEGIKSEKDMLLLEEKKKQDLINLKEKELAASLESTDELKQQIQQQKDTITDLQHNLEVAKSKIDKNSSLLKNAEVKIKLYEEQVTDDTHTSNLTSSAGVSTLEIHNGYKACMEITKELNTLKVQNSKLRKDLEQINLKNTQLTAENNALQSELMLKNQNMQEQDNDKLIASLKSECEELKKQHQQQEHTINDLESQLKEAKCEIDKNSNLSKDRSNELVASFTHDHKGLKQQNTELRQKNEKVKQQNEGLRKQDEEAKLQSEGLKQQNGELVQQNEEANLQNVDLRKENEEVKQQNERLRQQNGELVQQNKEVKQQNEGLRQQNIELALQNGENKRQNEKLITQANQDKMVSEEKICENILVKNELSKTKRIMRQMDTMRQAQHSSFEQMKHKCVQLEQENEELQSELQARKDQLGVIKQMNDEITELKHQLKEANSEIDEKSKLLVHAKTKIKMCRGQRLTNLNSFVCVTSSQIHNDRRMKIMKLRLRLSSKYHYRRRWLYVFRNQQFRSATV